MDTIDLISYKLCLVNFTYTITKNETIGIDIVLIFGGEDAMFSTWGHWENMLHMLLIFFFGVHIPEYYGCVVTVSLYKNIIIINKGFLSEAYDLNKYWTDWILLFR